VEVSVEFTIPSDDLIELFSRSSLLATGDRSHPAFGVTHLSVTTKGRLKSQVVNAFAGALNSVQTASGEGSIAGAVCITHNTVNGIQSVLAPKTEVNIKLMGGENEAQQLRIRAGDVAMRVNTLPASDALTFPTPPTQEEATWAEVMPENILAVIAHVAPFVAPEKDARANLQTVHLSSEFSEASDGRRVVRIQKSILPPGSSNVCAPSALFNVLRNYIDGKTAIRVAVTKANLWFVGKGWALFCRPLDVIFPNLDNFFYGAPDENGQVVADLEGTRRKLHGILLDRASAMVASQRVAAIYQKPQDASGVDAAPIIRFSMKNKSLTALVAKLPGANVSIDFAQRVPWSPIDGMDLDEAGIKELNEMKLNARFFGSIVGQMKEEQIQVLWTSSKDRIQIEQPDGMRCLLMPRSD
jgi:hypothetical protein